MGIIKLEGYICERCSHTWVSRHKHRNSGGKPVVCPACKTPYWDIPRKNKKRKEKNA